jgi:hypothetical protein
LFAKRLLHCVILIAAETAATRAGEIGRVLTFLLSKKSFVWYTMFN